MRSLKNRWRQWWQDTSVHNKELIDAPTVTVNGINLPRHTWLILIRICTGQGNWAFLLHRWNIVESPLCQCMDHIVQSCVMHCFEGNIREIHKVTDIARNWLENLIVNL